MSVDLDALLAQIEGGARAQARPLPALRRYVYLGTTDEVTTCDHCGRSDLKHTVALRDEDEGVEVFFGVVCAAHALKLTSKEVKAGAKAADDAHAAWERRAREARQNAEDARWAAFLFHASARVPRDYAGRLDRHYVIHSHLGGYAAARAAYDAWDGPDKLVVAVGDRVQVPSRVGRRPPEGVVTMLRPTTDRGDDLVLVRFDDGSQRGVPRDELTLLETAPEPPRFRRSQA